MKDKIITFSLKDGEHDGEVREVSLSSLRSGMEGMKEKVDSNQGYPKEAFKGLGK